MEKQRKGNTRRLLMVRSAEALNAQMEGDDILEREPARIPVAYDELYRRLDLELRLRDYSALLAFPISKDSPLDEPDFEVYRADLMDNGRVTKIDLVKEAHKAGVIGETETPISRWTNWPIPR
jgi:hypothetical protein